MNVFRHLPILALLLFPIPARAQHGTAGNGYYPSAYNGDTWTGVVSSLAPAARGISLVYTNKGKTSLFEGILAKNYRVQAKDDKQKQQIASTGVTIGAHLRVFYLLDQTSDDVGGATAPFKAFSNNLLAGPNDKKPRFNLVFLVEFLPDENESRTGTVISTNDSTREISLEVTNGARSENFIGVVIPGYQVRMKDGSFRELVISQIPHGTKLTVHYFDEMTGPDRNSGEAHRIYRIQFLSLPPSQ